MSEQTCRACGVKGRDLIPVAFAGIFTCKPCWERFLAWVEAESGRPLNEDVA